MQIALVNTVVANGGDAALLLGTLAALRGTFGDGCRFVTYDASPAPVWEAYPELTFRPALHSLAYGGGTRNLFQRVQRRLRWLVDPPRLLRAASYLGAGQGRRATRLLGPSEREALDALAASDLVVSVGGTYLVETYRLAPRFFVFGLVERLGLPLVLSTQSMGPFRRAASRRKMRRVLAHARLVLLRDEASLRHIEALLPPGTSHAVSADSAFALADPAVLEAARRRTSLGERPPRVAVSVREWPYLRRSDGMAGYLAAVAEAVTWLVRERGATVTFLSTVQGAPGYRYDDAAVAEQVRERLSADVRDNAQVEVGYHRPEALLDAYGQHDLLLATRMHAAILALCAGTPVLPIAYEFKTAALFERLGVGSWVREIETVTGDALIAGLETVERELPAVRDDLFGRVAAERAEAFRLGEAARAVLE